MKMPKETIQPLHGFKPVWLLTRAGLLGFALTCVFQFVVSPSVFANDGKVGVVTIDGEIIPAALFDYYRLQDLRKFKDCEPVANKEKIVDFVVAAKQSEGSNPTIIKNLQRALPETSDEKALKENVEQELRTLKNLERSYLKFLNFYASDKDLYEEYQIRVRDKDPYITNVTIVRVLEIKEPSGVGSDEKLIELATSIQQGTSFEEAEARYPSRYKIDNQTERWVTLDSLPHRINSETVNAGDVFGIEKILSGQSYYDPMVKIYEVKHLSQIRLSDDIHIDPLLERFGYGYLRQYLADKAYERKKHILMSQLWTNYSITEDGKEIHRVGIYKPCTGY